MQGLNFDYLFFVILSAVSMAGNQQWEYMSSKRIKHVPSGLCLHAHKAPDSNVRIKCDESPVINACLCSHSVLMRLRLNLSHLPGVQAGGEHVQRRDPRAGMDLHHHKSSIGRFVLCDDIRDDVEKEVIRDGNEHYGVFLTTVLI